MQSAKRKMQIREKGKGKRDGVASPRIINSVADTITLKREF